MPRRPVSVGLLGNAAEVFPELLRARRAAGPGHRPDLRARPAQRLPPRRLDVAANGNSDAQRSRSGCTGRAGVDGQATSGDARTSIAAGIPTVDYGNNIRQMARDEGLADAFDFPGFVPAYIRPLFCRGIGPFRWAALSGDPEDIYRTDARCAS